MIGVSAGLLLGALLSAVSAKDVLVMIEIVVFVFVRVLFRHIGNGGLNDEASLDGWIPQKYTSQFRFIFFSSLL